MTFRTWELVRRRRDISSNSSAILMASRRSRVPVDRCRRRPSAPRKQAIQTFLPGILRSDAIAMLHILLQHLVAFENILRSNNPVFITDSDILKHPSTHRGFESLPIRHFHSMKNEGEG